MAILFTDIVGSTELSQRLSAEVADEVRRGHFSILRQAITESGGTEVKNLRDGLIVVFSSASSALGCAVAMQQGVEPGYRGSEIPVGLRVRTQRGEVSREDDDFFGDPAVVAARLCTLCESGLVLASEWVRLTADRRNRHECRPLGDLTPHRPTRSGRESRHRGGLGRSKKSVHHSTQARTPVMSSPAGPAPAHAPVPPLLWLSSATVTVDTDVVVISGPRIADRSPSAHRRSRGTLPAPVAPQVLGAMAAPRQWPARGTPVTAKGRVDRRPTSASTCCRPSDDTAPRDHLPRAVALRLEKILQDTGIKLTSAFSTVRSASSRAMLEARRPPRGPGSYYSAPYATLLVAGGRTRRSDARSFAKKGL